MLRTQHKDLQWCLRDSTDKELNKLDLTDLPNPTAFAEDVVQTL